MSWKNSFFITSCVPKSAEILIILTWIELEKVISVRSEILVLLVKFVSSKTELEALSYKKPFLVRSKILELKIESGKSIFR